MNLVDTPDNRLSFYPLKHTRMTKLRITVKFIVGMLMRVRGLTPRTRTFTRVNVPVISYRVTKLQAIGSMLRGMGLKR